MARKLLLSGRRPYHSSFSTPEGQVLYKTCSPWKLIGRKASVYKVVLTDPTPGTETTDTTDEFEKIGEIEYHSIRSSRITYNGVSQSMGTFFRLEGRGIGWILSDRIFTGPDGKEYRWVVGGDKPALYTNESPRECVARYNQVGFVASDPDETSANLEIYPTGEHLLDIIVITLCYIERLGWTRSDVSKRATENK